MPNRSKNQIEKLPDFILIALATPEALAELDRRGQEWQDSLENWLPE